MSNDTRRCLSMLAIIAMNGASAFAGQDAEKAGAAASPPPSIVDAKDNDPVVARKPYRRPSPVSDVVASDHANDSGDKIDLAWTASSSDDATGGAVTGYRVERSSDDGKSWLALDTVTPLTDIERRSKNYVDTKKVRRNKEYRYRVVAVGPGGSSQPTETEGIFVPRYHIFDWSARIPLLGPVVEMTYSTRASSRMQFFNWNKFWFLSVLSVLCAVVIGFILAARRGRKLRVRKIAGLEVVDEAVGRATEMGRSCIFVPGIDDMNNIQTVAGITVLARVAKTAAEFDARVEVPTSRSLVMTAARDTVQSSYLMAGRPDAYSDEQVYYVTDEQFGFVAFLAGKMVREKPAACFYMGAFYAESLILAETGNSIGAIQVAGTAEVSQLPFFVAACDYTLIGEEFFAASAYLSGEPDQLGSLKGQDLGKLFAAALVLGGCLIATIAGASPATSNAARLLHYVKDVVLNSGGGE